MTTERLRLRTDGEDEPFNADLQFDEAPCGSPPNRGNNENSLWLKSEYGRERSRARHDAADGVAVTPADGAPNVSLGTSVSATFSEPIAAASVTGTSFVLRDPGGNAVAASVSASGSTATLQPSAALAAGTTHGDPPLRLERREGSGRERARVELHLVVYDTAPDTTPPTVAAVTPANGAGTSAWGRA